MRWTHGSQDTTVQGETGRCPSNGAQAEALKRKGGREQATKSKRRKLVAKKRMYSLSLSLSLEYCSAMRKEVLPFVTTWMGFKDAILTEITQTKAN